MSSYKEIEKEFERKIAELQKICKHVESEWMDQYRDFRSTGYKVKICLNCNKQLKRELIV